jgi:hemoglobin
LNPPYGASPWKKPRSVQPPPKPAALPQRLAPELKFVAAVALRFDTPLSIGETPDGVRLDFSVHGTVAGPTLNGKFPPCAAYLLIDVDGIGTINVRAPLLLSDGAIAELEATGRYDFGQDGYRRAAAGNLPNSDLGWCPRFFTGHPRYLWLNRALFLGVGELVPRETRVNYDLFLVASRASAPTASGVAGAPAPETPMRGSLYDRLGGRDNIDKIVNDFVDALDTSSQLNRQNPRLAPARMRVDAQERKRTVADVFCNLAGGPCDYTGKPLRQAHAPLRISEADWAIGGMELAKALTRNNIPKAEQDELLAIIGATKGEIVTQR